MNPSDPTPSDDALMQRLAAHAAAGDSSERDAGARDAEQAMRMLVERWERRVLAFAHRCLGDPDEARDVAQDTFVRVWHAGRAGRYDARGRFDAWLLRVAGNLCRSRLRRRRLLRWVSLSRTPEAFELLAPPAAQPDQLAQGERAQRLVDAALAKLPERQRIAVVLKRFEGLSYKDIAEVLDTTPAAVESLLMRANATLQQHLRRAGLLE